MGLESIYRRIALISPYCEVALRHAYRAGFALLKRFNPNKATKAVPFEPSEKADFEKVIGWLKDRGIGEGDLLVVHSGYGELERTGLTPDQIIDRLLELVGPSGTLAMPVIRRYRDMEKAKKEGKDMAGQTFRYNVRKTVVTSGMLPYTLMQREGAVVSHHPFNPLCAVGPHAKAMMEHNLDGEAPSPHGPDSCWKYCYDHGAKICSIGTDIEHHNTVGHIVEEAFGNWYWSDALWYDRFSFEVVDEKGERRTVTVRNRKEGWGQLHLAEINANELLRKQGVLVSDSIEKIRVGYVDAVRMVPVFMARNQKGYPYLLLPFENAKKIM